MSTLNVLFTGLCAFVPNTAAPNASGQVTSGQMRVLMVDATNPTGAHAVPHRPVLVVDVDQVEQGNGCRPWKYVFKDGDQNDMALFEIMDQELWIDGARPNALSFDAESVEGCPIDRTDDRFRWVASMRRINAGSGNLIANALRPTRAPRAVAARFKLTERAVTRHRWAEDTLRLIVGWRFSNDDGTSQAGFVRAMAEEVRLAYPFDGERIAIRAVADIHDETVRELDPICLKPQGSIINTFVANMPDDDIRRRHYTRDAAVEAAAGFAVQAVLPAAPGNRPDDHHFAHFYDLVFGGSRDRIPRPYNRCPLEPAGPAAGNPKCPPVQLDAHQDA